MAKCAVLVLSHIQLFAILWTVARQVPWDFPGKVLEWVPFPSPGVLSHPGIEFESPALMVVSLLLSPGGSKEGKKLHRIGTGLTEKAMATHSSTLAWKIPWTEEPGRLQSMGSRRVRHD